LYHSKAQSQLLFLLLPKPTGFSNIFYCKLSKAGQNPEYKPAFAGLSFVIFAGAFFCSISPKTWLDIGFAGILSLEDSQPE
jgi:hypothetical protein